MTKRVSQMTPAEHAAHRAHERATRKSRAKPGAQPTSKLTDDERMQLAYLAHMRLWPKRPLAAAFGVTDRVLRQAVERHPRLR